MTPFLQKLKGSQPQLGVCIMYPSPGVVERIGADWDWIWLDGQHGQLGYSETLNLVRACDLVQRPAFVRVPGHDAGAIGLALDTGAAGVIVPCVNAAEQAQQLVLAAKFHPLGDRSYGGRRPIDLHGRNYSDTANEDVLLIAQIETPRAIENVETIAAIPGIDALFLGPDDLLMRRGYEMNAPRNRANLGDDMQRVIEACRANHKFGVIVAAGAEMLDLALELGFSMIVAGGDVPFLANGSKQAAEVARRAISRRTDSAPSTSSSSTSLY